MQISTNQFYSNTASLMQKLTQSTNDIQTQISSTKKYAAPSDNVVAYQQLATIGRANADDTAYSANVSLAQSLLQQSDSTLTSVENDLTNAAALVTQANSDTLTDAQRKTISIQLKGVLSDLVSLANTKDARGQPLYGAATGDSAVTQNADGSVAFSGTGTPAAIPIGDGTSIQASDSAGHVFGGIQTASGTSDVFAIISKFTAALDAGGSVTAAASEAGTSLQAALTQVTGVHGSVGARETRLDLTAAQLKTTATDREADRSAIEDTDISTAVIDLQKMSTALQATQASFTKLSALSLFDYLK
jgi:flagellar hook-associated protein 3 FlgL